MNLLVRASTSVSILAASLTLAGVACVSPDAFDRDAAAGGEGGAVGTAGSNGGDTGGSSGGAGSGAGGHVTTGAGGTTVSGAGGRSGVAGTSGSGGAVVIGPAANLTDNFETGDVTQRWLAPQSSATLSGTKIPCGAWSVVMDGSTSNHAYEQTSTTCTGSNPTWAAGGNRNWTDMRLQVKVQFPAGATTATIISIGVRYVDSSNVYLLEFSNDGKTKLRSRIAGSSSDVASDTSKNRVVVPAGQWTTIAISISGTTLNAYIGDGSTTPVLTGTVNGLTAGGVALGVNNQIVSFDDVLVAPP